MNEKTAGRAASIANLTAKILSKLLSKKKLKSVAVELTKSLPDDQPKK